MHYHRNLVLKRCVLIFVAAFLLTLPFSSGAALVRRSPFSIAQNGPVFNASINLSNDSGNATNPDVWNVGDNVYAVWTEGSAGIMFRASHDGGLIWVPPLSSSPMDIAPPGRTTAPLLSANGSNVYVVWSQTVGAEPAQIFEATSTTAGANFSAAVQITSGTNESITPVIASWGNNVYVGWAYYPGSYVSCSSDLGALGSWSKPFEIGAGHEPQLASWGGKYVYAASDKSVYVSANNCGSWTNEGYNAQMGAEPWIWAYGPNVYCAWEGKGNTSNVAVVVSNNYGATWTPPNKIPNLPGLNNAWAPMVWAYGNTSWIAVHDEPGGANSHVYVYTSTNAGASWNGPTMLNEPPASGGATSFPFTVVSSDGANVFVAWSQQLNPTTWSLFVSYSSDGGSTWTPPPGINVSQNPNGTEASDSDDLATAAIASYGPYCYAVWQYSANFTNQIYFAANTPDTISTTSTSATGSSASSTTSGGSIQSSSTSLTSATTAITTSPSTKSASNSVSVLLASPEAELIGIAVVAVAVAVSAALIFAKRR